MKVTGAFLLFSGPLALRNWGICNLCGSRCSFTNGTLKVNEDDPRGENTFHSCSNEQRGGGKRKQLFELPRGNRKCEKRPGCVDRALTLQLACNLNVAPFLLLFLSEVKDLRFHPLWECRIYILKTQDINIISTSVSNVLFRMWFSKLRPAVERLTC